MVSVNLAKSAKSARRVRRATPDAVAEPALDDIRETMDRFIAALYERQRAESYRAAVELDAFAVGLGVVDRLATKIALYLEREGFLEFDKDAVDLTVEGILRAEGILREKALKASKEG